MSKKLIEIASEIVNIQASKTTLTAAEISSALREVFATLNELQKVESGEIELPKIQEAEQASALKPEDSIQNDKVICLECGAEMRQLTKLHLASHDLSAKEYKKKYGFKAGTPLAARSLTRARSKAAKKRGVPENLKKYMEARRQAKATVQEPVVKPPVSDSPGAARAKRIRSRFSPKTAE
ncbi:MAG: MucR family transcriptional regulator [Syntrophobacteraceae bacterium]